MNRILSIFLVLSLLIMLFGCTAQNVTPTNVTNTDAPPAQGVVSSAGPEESQPEESVVSKKQEISITEQSQMTSAVQETTVHSEVENSQQSVHSEVENSQQSVLFTKWTEENHDTYYWLQGISFETENSLLADVVLCNSQEELLSFLREKGYPVQYANQYSSEYFASNSLLVFEGGCSSGSAKWYVDTITQADQVLDVSLRYVLPSLITHDTADRLYHLEIQEKIRNVQQLQCTTTYLYTELDGNTVEEKQTTTKYSVQ